MLTEKAEFLLGSLFGVNQGLCPACAAKMLGCAREEMVKATKELILYGSVLVENATCSACQCIEIIARLRLPRM